MSIKAGSLTFRMFRAQPMDRVELVERLAGNAMPPLNTLADGQIQGWVTGRHALDRNLTMDTAFYGSILCLGLTMAEKKVPESLVRAECRMEELAQMSASGQERLSASARAEIRRSITERLMATAAPTLRTVDLVQIGRESDLVLASCISDNQVDQMQIAWTIATGKGMVPLMMESICPELRECGPVSFSPNMENDECDAMPASEFLTWLWFMSEARGGMVTLPNGHWALMVEGPLLMGMEGTGAHEALLRKGEPLLSAEAKSALMAGKKLRKAKITLARGDESYTFVFDAPRFAVRSLRMPEGEKLDAVSRFQTRMTHAELFCETLIELAKLYGSRRLSADAWKSELSDMREWVGSRKFRT